MSRTLKGTDPKAAKPSKPKILIYGRPGVGKTWASIDFPNTYLIDCEGGANLSHYTDKLKASGGNYMGPDNGANDFAAVTEEIITLATTKHRFRTLVIDSYSKLFQTQVSMDLERIQKKQLEKGEEMKETYGAEKKPAVNWTRRWLRWFDRLDLNVVLVCHERDLYKDSKLIGSTFDGWDKLEHELHLVLNITKQGPARRAKVIKSRLKEFADAEVFDWSYDAFANKYGRDVMEADAKTVEPANEAQIKAYSDLLAAVKVDPKVLEKWAEACDDVADLAAEDIQKRIDWLTAKLPKAGTAA